MQAPVVAEDATPRRRRWPAFLLAAVGLLILVSVVAWIWQLLGVG